ncbi:TonB-dependent receptor [Paramixta manurensis]|uniref:TonB-dependent receptor n=1 Tax=Paramixta manurensis TaxID=2740817 RepID=A0A6M8U7M5_9GAMM|nr:TonB-dependent receptor [Erwiniaceae bacterium PD-1]
MHSAIRPANRFKPTLIALLVSAAVLPAAAATNATTNATTTNATTAPGQPAQHEETMTVVATPENDFKPGGDQLVPAYLDGQVAHGGRLGMMGEQKAMDVPFNVIGFTSKLIADKQATTIADVVRNDAGIQNVQGFGNFAETYRIRGFELDGDDMTFGGLPGVLPRQVVDTSMIERVEVFKGANGLFNGAATSGVGGMINLEPKHADDVPLTRIGLDYTSSSQIGTSLDVGRRFGDNNQFGVRVNLLQREGDTAVHDEKKRTTLASIGLDYRGDRFRSSLDFGYQKKTFHDGLLGVNISGVDFIPNVPDNSHNYSQKWVYSDIESQFGMTRAEYDLTDNWTAYAALGGQHSHELGDYASPTLLARNGDATIGRLDTNKYIDIFSGMAGIRGSFDTGFVSHKVNFGYSAEAHREKTAYAMALTPEDTNIYHTPDVPNPTADFFGGDMGNPRPTSRTRAEGYLLSDTLGILNDKALLTLGARHQSVTVRNYAYGTAQEDTSARFDKSRWTPTYGLVVKPWDNISLYANHTEALQPGSSAPEGTTNFGQTTGIIHSKQNEVGVKVDYQRIGGSLALFEIKKPSGVIVGDTYTLDGEQRHRGIELNVFGEPVLGFRVNGSATWLDPTITKSQDGQFDGKDPIGVPHYNMVLGAEYDIRPVTGLTATATVNRSGSQFVDSANTKKLDSYTTLDLGMRYRMKLQQNDLVWRAGVENVTNEKYWSNVESFGTYIYQGEPRTLKVSVSYDF